MNKPVVNTQVDGNAFAVIGHVSQALKKNGNTDQAKEFTERAFGCESYDKLLQLTCEYVVWK